MSTLCVLSTHVKNHSGYGQITKNGKSILHHRWIYMEAHGLAEPDIKRKVVMHTCDNPACINPEHLVLGTQADNMADKTAKGRAKGLSRPGTANPRAKLTEVDVLAIRSSRGTQQELANKYGVSQAHISEIVLRKTWKHL